MGEGEGGGDQGELKLGTGSHLRFAELLGGEWNDLPVIQIKRIEIGSAKIIHQKV